MFMLQKINNVILLQIAVYVWLYLHVFYKNNVILQEE